MIRERALYVPCPYCDGAGFTIFTQSLGLTREEATGLHIVNHHGWPRIGNHFVACLCCGAKFRKRTKQCVFKMLGEHLRQCDKFLHHRCLAELTGGVVRRAPQ